LNVDLVLAPNPGPFTGPGTHTWIVSSSGKAVVIDPGPVMPEHRSATLEALAPYDPVLVLVTHHHPDHAPAANELANHLGVPAAGPAHGIDFSPNRIVSDGDVMECGAIGIVAVATPGHTPDSTCYLAEGALFTGDHIMGGSTVIVEDMAGYLDSLRRLRGLGADALYPGHGAIMREPVGVIDGYLAHRLEREAQILAAVRSGEPTLGRIVESVYVDVDPSLHAAAAISVEAHLRKLADDRMVRFDGGGWDAVVGPR
jgi:glyoxylase-like metal-dependent hydrolase (beta-lactamase superfamily II)